MLIKVLTPGFFARQQPRKPVVIALLSMVLNAFLAWLLGFHLGFNHVGLALASSLSAFFTVFALVFYLRKDSIYVAEKGWFVFFIRLIIACFVLYIFIEFFNQDVANWRLLEGVSRFLNLAVLIGFGIFAYLATLWILGLRKIDFQH
jgi:putative peptidoglycan lipid II flippase